MFLAAFQSERQPPRTGYPSCVCRGCISVTGDGRYRIPRSQILVYGQGGTAAKASHPTVAHVSRATHDRITEL